MNKSNITDPTGVASIYYWVDAGDLIVERLEEPVKTRRLGRDLYMCTKTSLSDLVSSTYQDVAEFRRIIYLAKTESCSPDEAVDVGPDLAEHVVVEALCSIPRIYESWLKGAERVPVYASRRIEGLPAGILVKSGPVAPEVIGVRGTPVAGSVLFSARSGSKSLYELAHSILREWRGCEGWGLRRPVVASEWEFWHVGRGMHVALLRGFRRSSSSLRPGWKLSYSVRLPTMVVVYESTAGRGVLRFVGEVASIIGKLELSRVIANNPAGRDKMIIYDYTPTFSEEGLAAELGDPWRFGELIGEESYKSGWEKNGCGIRLAKRYSLTGVDAGSVLYVFPSYHHYTSFLNRVVEEYVRIARYLVGENTPERRERIKSSASHIRRFLLALEGVLASLNRQRKRIRYNLHVLEKNIFNLKSIVALHDISDSRILAEVLNDAEAAMIEFKRLLDEVEDSIDIVGSYIGQVRDLEETAGRVIQERLNDLMTILASAGLYSILEPLISGLLGQHNPLLTIAVTGAFSASLPVGIRIFEWRKRSEIYKR